MDVIKASKPQLNTFLCILTLQCWHYHPQMFANTTHQGGGGDPQWWSYDNVPRLVWTGLGHWLVSVVWGPSPRAVGPLLYFNNKALITCHCINFFSNIIFQSTLPHTRQGYTGWERSDYWSSVSWSTSSNALSITQSREDEQNKQLNSDLFKPQTDPRKYNQY